MLNYQAMKSPRPLWFALLLLLVPLPGLSQGVRMGSMIHAAHAAKVQERIDAAVRAGASVLTGARRRSDLGDAFVEPTVLTHGVL